MESKDGEYLRCNDERSDASHSKMRRNRGSRSHNHLVIKYLAPGTKTTRIPLPSPPKAFGSKDHSSLKIAYRNDSAATLAQTHEFCASEVSRREICTCIHSTPKM